MKFKQAQIVFYLSFSLFLSTSTANAGEWVTGTASNNAGSRNYSLWVPSDYDKRNATPLVMMLHGCTQQSRGLAASSGMNTVADKNNFLVVYPEQTKEANPLQCWNWFDPSHQKRDQGEPSLLATIIQQVRASHNVDTGRVYVAGISAGGAMAVVMGVTYPDIFSAIGVSSGLAFRAGTDVQSGLVAMKQGRANPKELGLDAFASMKSTWQGDKRRMAVIVFQGDADPYVNSINAEQIIVQWAKTNDLLDDGKDNDSVKVQPAKTSEGVVAGGHRYAKSIYFDSTGKLLMEKWMVKEMGHAWSGSPGVAPFADPKGPNASEELWRFFGETSRAKPPKPRAK